MNTVKYTTTVASGSGLEAIVLSLPERFEQEGHVIHSGRNVLKVLQLGDKKVVVKRFGRGNIFQRFSYSTFRRSKALRSYDNAMRLLSLGFDTPEPLACIEERRCGIYRCGWYVCALDEGTPLDKLDGRNPSVLTPLADLIVRLHSAGVMHHDLNRTNILSHETPRGYRFSLVDINRMDFGKTPGLWDGIENFMTLPVRDFDFEYLSRCYLEHRGLYSEKILDEVMRRKYHRDGKRHTLRHLRHRLGGRKD